MDAVLGVEQFWRISLTLIFWLLAAVMSAVQDNIKDDWRKSIFSLWFDITSLWYHWFRGSWNHNKKVPIFLSNAWHLAKFLKLCFFFAIIATWMSLVFPIWPIIIRGLALAVVWGVVFNLFYGQAFRFEDKKTNWWKIWE